MTTVSSGKISLEGFPVQNPYTICKIRYWSSFFVKHLLLLARPFTFFGNDKNEVSLSLLNSVFFMIGRRVARLTLLLKCSEKDWSVNLRELNGDIKSKFLESPLEPLRFFLLFHYFLLENQLAGFIVCAEQINRMEELSYEDYDLMRMVANQSIVAIQGIRLTLQLASAKEMAAIGKISTFVLHDLKNQVSGLAFNA